MLNVATQGLGAQVAQWFANLKQSFSSTKDVYGDLLGVDIDDSSIISILLRNPLGNVRVARAEVVELSSGAVTDDAIVDSVAVTNAIKNMIKKAGIQTVNAVIAVPGSKVVIKQIKLDAQLNEQDAEARAWQEARKTFPEIVKNLYLDFVQIEEPSVEKNKKFLLVLVIVRKEDITPRVEVLQQANLTTKIVDVDFYALERVYRLFAKQLPNSHAEKYVALIDFNPHSIVFVVMHKKRGIYFSRQAYTGDILVSIVQRAMNVGITPVKSKPVILPSLRITPMQTLSGTGSSLESQTSSDSLSEDQKSHVVMSIRRMFQSFYAENTGKVIEHIVMTGRCSLIADLTQYIEKMLGIPTIIGNPLLSLKMGEHVDAEKMTKLGPAFALSCGLSMRGISLWI